MRKPWKHALIVKVFKKHLEFKFFDQKIRELWKPCRNMSLIDIGKGFYIAKFDSPEDFLKVVKGGPWYILKYFVSIQQWVPNFNSKNGQPSTTATWVRLPGLPLEYYDREILARVGNKIGKLISMDARTANSKRGRYARFCIEIDLSKPFPTSLKFGRYVQELQFEGLSFCFGYGYVGHDSGKCQEFGRRSASSYQYG
nr:uncharacterized protein LOC113688220 [Coffea arabica]